MTLLTQYDSADQAAIVQGMLESNGIDCSVETNALSSLFPAPGAGGGGAALYVNDNDLEKARQLLAEHGD